MKQIKANTKDAKAIYFLVDDETSAYIIAKAKMEIEIEKLQKGGHVVIERSISPTIGEFKLRVGIVYIPKGKYKLVK